MKVDNCNTRSWIDMVIIASAATLGYPTIWIYDAVSR